MLDKAIRELDRERMGLQNQEKKLVAEIKKMAKQGQMVSGLCNPLHAWGHLLQTLCPRVPARHQGAPIKQPRQDQR